MKRGLSVLLAVSGATALGIAYIHRGQKVERENLHKGVLRDKELYRLKLQEKMGDHECNSKKKFYVEKPHDIYSHDVK